MNRINNRQFIYLMIIIVGIFVSVFAVLNYQTFFSRAGSTDYTNVTVTAGQDNSSVNCNADGVCDTQSLDVNFQIKNINAFEDY